MNNDIYAATAVGDIYAAAVDDDDVGDDGSNGSADFHNNGVD